MSESSHDVDPVLTRKETARALKVSIPTLDRMHLAGTGPKRLRLSARRVGYRLSDLIAWMERSAEGRAA
jgi:predicted DNA-binding transcriptional regulator AlpA